MAGGKRRIGLCLLSALVLSVLPADEIGAGTAGSRATAQQQLNANERRIQTRTLIFDRATGKTRPTSVRAELVPLESPPARLHRQLRGHSLSPLDAVESNQTSSPAPGLLTIETEHPGPLLLRLTPRDAAQLFEPLEIEIPPFFNQVALPPAILYPAESVPVAVKTPDGQPALWSWLRDARKQTITTEGWRAQPLAAFVDEQALYDVPVSDAGRAIEIINEWSSSLRWLEGRSGSRPIDDLDRSLAAPELLRLELRTAAAATQAQPDAVVLIDGRPVATAAPGSSQPLELWVPPGSIVEALTAIAPAAANNPSTARGSLPFQSKTQGTQVLVLRDDPPPPTEIVDRQTGDPISGGATVEVFDPITAELLGHRVAGPGSLTLFRPASESASRIVGLARAATLAGRVVDATGAPVSGATVLLQELDSDRILAVAYSGKQGSFVLPRVPAALNARLTAESFDAWSGSEPPEPRTAEATVETPAAGQVSSDTVLILERPTRLTGRVTDSAGQPVASASVTIRSLDPVDARVLRTVRPREPTEPVLTTAVTDSDGTFRAEHQGGERLLVTLARPSFATLAFERSLTGSEDREEIDLGVFVLPVEYQLELLIQDRNEAPIAGAEVALDLLSSHSEDGRIGSLAEPGTGLGAPDLSAIVPGHELVPGASDEEGRLVIGALPPESRISLLVARDGFVMKRLFGLEPTSGASDTTEPIRVVLEPEAVVSGRVFDDRGRPVETAHVALEGTAASQLPPNLWDKSDERGDFRIGGLPAGRYRMWARAADQPEYEDVRFEIAAGQELEGLDFHAPESAWIDGEVLGRDGMPISDARVIAELQLARTERDGSFRLEPISLGEQTVEARLPNGDRLARTVMVPAEGITVTLQPASENDRQGATLSGRVLDLDGIGIDGIRLTLRQEAAPRYDQTRSGSDGFFAFFGLSAGEYSLTANQERAGTDGERSELSVAYETISIASSDLDPEDVTVILEPAALFEGILIGDEPERSATWFATLRSDAGEERRAFLPPGQSSFELTSLRPGLWQIEVRRARAGRTPLTLGKTERLITPRENAVTVEIDVSQGDQDDGVVLSGQVRRLDRAVGQVEGSDRLWLVLARPGERASRSATRVGSLGGFEFESLEPGLYDLMVASDRTVLSHLERLDLFQNLETTVALEERLLTGVVFDQVSGSPVAGARIMVVGPGGDSSAGPVTRTVTGADGRFQVRALVHTASFLEVSRQGYRSRTFALTETDLSISPLDSSAVEPPSIE